MTHEDLQIGDTVLFNYSDKPRAGVVHSIHEAGTGNVLLTLDLQGQEGQPPFKSFKVEKVVDLRIV